MSSSRARAVAVGQPHRSARVGGRTVDSSPRPGARHAGLAHSLTDKEFVSIARALADPTRVQILRTIASCASLCCGAIGREVPVRPATVSHHLRVLAEAGLVDTQRDGQFINVRINAGRLDQFQDAVGAVAVAGTAPAAAARRRPAPARQS